MIRSAFSISALAITAILSACGGGGGGGGSSGPNLDTQATISAANFAQVASLAVRGNTVVADSPNYNEGYPEFDVGVTPVNGLENCGAVVADGTRTRTYTETDADPATRDVNDKLVIDYNNCKFDLKKEVNNCVNISETSQVVTLIGRVETLVVGTTTTGYTSILTFSNLQVTLSGGTDTINGKLQMSSTVANPKQITFTSINSDPLRRVGGGVTERLRSATIAFTDNQQGCDTADPLNNAYTISSTTTSEVAASNLGFVNVTVTNNLGGDSDTDGGFPTSGAVTINGSGGTFMTLTTLAGGQVRMIINNVNQCDATWSQIFSGVLPAGC